MTSYGKSVIGWTGSLLVCLTGLACGESDLIPLQVAMGSRSVSKLPFVIAEDQGLYENHGLDVNLWMPPPDFEGGKQVRGKAPRKPDISINGATPMMVDVAVNARGRHLVVLASTDCVVRAHIVGRRGIDNLEDLKGRRLGITPYTHTTTGFVALLLARRMGWDPVQDMSIMFNGRDLDLLREGKVDAIVASERWYALALQQGFPILSDTRSWGEPIAGNSVRVEPAWLEDSTNREAASRFLKATAEAIAVFHQNRELAIDVLGRWYGITDRELAEVVYEEGASIPRRPYPCYEGITRTFELYDSNEMRRYSPDDFYDDSLLRVLDDSGFIDSLYSQ
jgi:ABC-type nitrate/sulfonate/bicarbonate transport system substrate-binding protein